MSKKTVFIFLCLLLISAVFLYFIRNNKRQINPAQKKEVIVLLDWFPNTNHTGIYVAKDKGFFDREGLDVKIIQPEQGENAQVVASGKADFAVSSQEAVTQARAANIPLISIAAIIQHNTSAFASLSQSNIKTVKDFEGKRYGGWGSPIEEQVIKAVMEQANADYAKVKNITIGTTDFFKTIGTESDFQWIFYGWDGIEAKRRAIDINTIMLKDLNPILDYYTPVIITNEQHVKEQKNLVIKFMRAVYKGYEMAIENPSESADILFKSAPELDRDLVIQSQNYLSEQYAKDASKWGVQKEEVWQRYATWLYENKLIEKTVEINKAFTNEFLP